MKPIGRLFAILSVLVILALNACTTNPINQLETASTPFQPEVADTPVATIEEFKLYLSEQTPEAWLEEIQGVENVAIVEQEKEADLMLVPKMGKADENTLVTFNVVFAVAVPFFTVEDEINFDILSTLWRGSAGEDLDRKIFVTKTTRDLLAEAWGEPGTNVTSGKSSDLLAQVKALPSSIAIIPFEEISPQWKILKIGRISPLDKPFKQEKYPLLVSFDLVPVVEVTSGMTKIAEEIRVLLPNSNRDESKMTVLMMSGTTAITRGLAYKVTINETDYPIAQVKDWFLSADLRHVSNESPFVEDCPPPDPYAASLIFCTHPDMIEVLDKIGINIVELTGNHIKDYLEENLIYTMRLYEGRGWGYYAAGEDVESAREPLLIEHNGNRIAFIGCNAVGPNSVWATSVRAGAAECDFDYLTQTIRELKNQGYTVITTFQHEELTKQDGAAPVLMFAEKISVDFQVVAEAGSDIVQGSQAHYPMGFEFVGDNLIHYGLGNFLFDQMWDPNRNEFIDRHIIYDGEYINTELLTAILMDWSQPTPMDKEQRALFLEEIFTASIKKEK